MRKIAHLIPEAIGREEILRAGRAMRVLRQWPEIVGPILASKSAPERFDHGTVWVAVTGSEWAQELRMSKSLILAKLRNISGETNLFSEIRFGVRELPAVAAPEELDLGDKKAEYRQSLEGLTISEIRERRVRRYQ